MRKALENLMKFLTAGTLLVMLLFVVWQVFTRYVLSNPSTWSEELVSYLFAWSTLLEQALLLAKEAT